MPTLSRLAPITPHERRVVLRRRWLAVSAVVVAVLLVPAIALAVSFSRPNTVSCSNFATEFNQDIGVLQAVRDHSLSVNDAIPRLRPTSAHFLADASTARGTEETELRRASRDASLMIEARLSPGSVTTFYLDSYAMFESCKYDGSAIQLKTLHS